MRGWLRSQHFNPRSPHGERRTMLAFFQILVSDFNPRSPHGERQLGMRHIRRLNPISTHAPRTGSDGLRQGWNRAKILYFNPRSPHGERRTAILRRRNSLAISTHAPRTGSDLSALPYRSGLRKISTHAPRTGSDANGYLLSNMMVIFQPTLPARGATEGVENGC